MRLLIPFLLFDSILATVYSGFGNFSITPSVRTDYKLRLIDQVSASQALAGAGIYWPAFYQISILVDPCRDLVLTGGLADMCCSGTSQVNCQDHPDDVIGGLDLQVAYMQNAHVSTCVDTDFSDDPNCGTYIEIHEATPSDGKISDKVAKVLSSVQISDAGGAFQTTYLRTSGLCAGPYELWWVVRTRSGPYVQLKKPFTIQAPFC